MLTVLEIIKRTTDFFAGKGIESPRLNAELLIGQTAQLINVKVLGVKCQQSTSSFANREH